MIEVAVLGFDIAVTTNALRHWPAVGAAKQRLARTPTITTSALRDHRSSLTERAHRVVTMTVVAGSLSPCQRG